MDNKFELLIEKEEMWARMLMEVLEDQNIPFTAHPVFGAGLVVRAGAMERLQIFVPTEYLEKASALTDALFSDISDE